MTKRTRRSAILATVGGIAVALLAAFMATRAADRVPEATPPEILESAPEAMAEARPTVPTPTVYRWERFTERDGLPSYKALAIAVDGERVWVGTNEGLALYENGAFRTFTTDDGLSHDVVINLKVDERTGDLWIGTAAGLTRYSAGKFTRYTQVNSGLQNDMVYCVDVDGPHVWAATAAGISRLDTRTGQWSIWNETNTPMHEPWVYGVSAGEEMVYVAVWAGGLLEYDKTRDQWKDYPDPDGEMEIDVFPDDGVVHDVVSFVDYEDGLVWVATYFGLSIFDGTRWKGYFDDTSGLVGNFINFVNANGRVGWIGTDRGLSTFDGKLWRTYRRLDDGSGEVLVSDVGGKQLRRIPTQTAPTDNYVLGVDFQGDAVWLATENGISRGVPDRAADARYDLALLAQ